MIEESQPSGATAAALILRARMLLDAKRPGDAIGVLHQALATSPGDWHSLCLLSFAYLQVGQPADALSAAGYASAAAPGSDWPHRLRASALIKLDRPPEALAEAKQAVNVDPTVPESYIILTEAEIANRNIPAARAAAQQARELAPERCGGHVALSMVELKARRWTLAEDHARAALAIDPESTAALNNLGVALQGLGRRREAVHYLGTASRLDPRNPLYRRNAVGAAARYGSVVLVALVGLQFFIGNVSGGLFLGCALVASRLVIMSWRGGFAGIWRTPLERWRRRKRPRVDPQAPPELMKALRQEGRRANRSALGAGRMADVAALVGMAAGGILALSFAFAAFDLGRNGAARGVDLGLAAALTAATVAVIRFYRRRLIQRREDRRP